MSIYRITNGFQRTVLAPNSSLGYARNEFSSLRDQQSKDPNSKNVVNCDHKLRSILLGKPQVELSELPTPIKLYFPKDPK